jgi:peptidoglycan/LPS O-acetylase OafA/YrhL
VTAVAWADLVAAWDTGWFRCLAAALGLCLLSHHGVESLARRVRERLRRKPVTPAERTPSRIRVERFDRLPPLPREDQPW